VHFTSSRSVAPWTVAGSASLTAKYSSSIRRHHSLFLWRACCFRSGCAAVDVNSLVGSELYCRMTASAARRSESRHLSKGSIHHRQSLRKRSAGVFPNELSVPGTMRFPNRNEEPARGKCRTEKIVLSANHRSKFLRRRMPNSSRLVESASRELHMAGPIDIRKVLRPVAGSDSLKAEAEAGYAAFFGLMRKTAPDAVEDALRSDRQTIDNRNSWTDWSRPCDCYLSLGDRRFVGFHRKSL
jgi:hypothetical protein